MMVLDEEVYILPYQKACNKKLIYAPVRGYIEIIEKQDADEIEKGSISSKLINVLRSMPLKDLDVMGKGFPVLNIDFSDGCNMRCIYCYAGRGEGSVNYQTKENIDHIISIYFDYLQQQSDYKKNTVCPITFTNDAEPTFAPNLLMHAVKMIKEKACEYNLKPILSMPTNGAFGSKMREFIIENFHSISFSFEGLETIQNKHRPMADGSPSYDHVYQNAKALYESGIKIGFNVVVTINNLNYLKETVDYFNKHFPGTFISFSPVNLAGRALKEQAHLTVDYSVFQNKLLEATAYAKGTLVKIRDKNIQNYHVPRRHYCTSTARPNWNVNLKGEIYACMESKAEAMKIGEIDFNTHELKLRSEHIQTLKECTVERIEKCSDCFAKYLCAGGCVVRNEKRLEDCDHIRQKCLYLINEAYEQENLFKIGQAMFKIRC